MSTSENMVNNVTGMSCAACSTRVEKAVSGEKCLYVQPSTWLAIYPA